MQSDKTTLNDLSIFDHIEEQSVFHHLNFTTTSGGREYFRHMLASPFNELGKIQETQQILKLMIKYHTQWPAIITNGTIMVIEKYFDTPVDDLPRDPNPISAFTYSLLSSADYSLTRYSLKHFADFAKGCNSIVHMFNNGSVPTMLATVLERIKMLLTKPVMQHLIVHDPKTQFLKGEVLRWAYFLRQHYKPEILELVGIFSRMDAWYGMATCCKNRSFTFPTLTKQPSPFLEAEGLYHLLLPTPVTYNVGLEVSRNFMFLTGANMAGKSTFIKAVGVAVYLAHVGMGVPAKRFDSCLFDGILSNIQVEDNLVKGESYFFNEVKRVKKTIEKINDGRNWLILIDELFKGTNVQDAMKCSTIVIEGLRKLKNALFILSTHLYEIGDGLKQYPNIKFSYFETHTDDGQLVFSFQLKDGISNDRLGYLILKREGVVEMLEGL